jgi:hypothetical protein
MAFIGMFFQDGLRARRDFGFKLLTSSVPAQKTKKLNSEPANGRLAMMAFHRHVLPGWPTGLARLRFLAADLLGPGS